MLKSGSVVNSLFLVRASLGNESNALVLRLYYAGTPMVAEEFSGESLLFLFEEAHEDD